VIEKADTGGDGRAPLAVEVNRNLDRGFFGGPFRRSRAHNLLRNAAPFIRALAASPIARDAQLQ
jgi:hypothetical protein